MRGMGDSHVKMSRMSLKGSRGVLWLSYFDALIGFLGWKNVRSGVNLRHAHSPFSTFQQLPLTPSPSFLCGSFPVSHKHR